MTDIMKLPSKWREGATVCYDANAKFVHERLAGELESALPVWTKITDDPDTWPEQSEDILLSSGVGFLEAGEWGVTIDEGMQKYIGRYWRPLCDLDYPPKDKP
ncbi:MAG: hypothetical protein KOO63_08295 [Bacteroidales bacterium]|nr:hypothetical protein [Candidatus Latescibacterota bacterium]